MNLDPKTVLVDLTPMLPGGENGGAKVFTLELLKHLAQMAPSTTFILLIQSAVFDELESLASDNLIRTVLVRPAKPASFFARAVGYIFRKLPNIPQRFSLIGYRMHSYLRRRAAKPILKNIQADLLFCPFTAPTYAKPGVPTVCTIYDLQFKTYPAFFDSADVANRTHAFGEACRLADKLAAISEYSRQCAIKHGAISPHQIETIHLRMANRMKAFEEKKPNLLNRLGLSPKRYLLYPANFWLHKNHDLLLTAFSMASHQSTVLNDFKLVCTGAPSDRQRFLQRAVKAMQLESRVLFTSFLSHDELAALMQDCAGMIFPSLYEGFGLPLLEAMAVDIPVACSNTTSLPEVAETAAIFFDPRRPSQIAEAMVTLISDEARRKQLIDAGRARVELFSDPKRMATEYWHLFQKAYHQHGVQ